MATSASRGFFRPSPELPVPEHKAMMRSVGFNREIAFWDPEQIKHVLTRADDFILAPALSQLMYVLFGDSVLSQEGPVWKNSRSSLSHALLRPDNFARRLPPIVERHTVQSVNRLAATLHDSVDILDLARDFALAVIGDAIITPDSARPVAWEQIAADTLKGARAYPWHLTEMFVRSVTPIPFPRLPLRSLASVSADSGQLMQIILDAKQNGYDKDDILGDLVRYRHPETKKPLSAQAIYDQITALIGAGFFTTQSTIALTFSEIAKNPDVLGRCYDQARITTGTAQSPYIDDCIKETLRLFPPVPGILRQSKKSWRWDDQMTVTSRDILKIDVRRLHRDPDNFTDPETFKPERFAEMSQAQLKHIYMPFGFGARACIGKQLAVLESGMLLTALFRHFTWRVDQDFEGTMSSIAFMQPRGSLRATPLSYQA